MMNEDAASDGVVMQYNIYDPYQYPWMSFNFFLLFWLAGLLSYSLHLRLSPKFRQDLDESKRRNVVIYILQGLATTVALGFQLYGSVDLLFWGKDTTTPDRIHACLMAWIIVCILYIWELLYRIEIGIPLLLHHIVTIILIQVGYSSFFDTANLSYFRYGLLLTFHATTEQFTFVALYCYRMGLMSHLHKAFFLLAAVQAAFFKALVTVALVVYFALGIMQGVFHGSWGMFWKVCFPPLLLVLYIVQLYSAYTLAIIGRRCGKPRKEQEPEEDKPSLPLEDDVESQQSQEQVGGDDGHDNPGQESNDEHA
ncbi:expressed unknown protein [Seminavis robusta]|uniref:TLC domain-containing protein n=1 Tax=Seminavis robusta TaxID=568900 RepID=A0A9N8DW58_9STRA|nr:expressed unknown protein [Seminavis robusta]|eukprot:Sro420_g139220.1 n/a (310) ;mRNA; r:1801-2730